MSLYYQVYVQLHFLVVNNFTPRGNSPQSSNSEFSNTAQQCESDTPHAPRQERNPNRTLREAAVLQKWEAKGRDIKRSWGHGSPELRKLRPLAVKSLKSTILSTTVCFAFCDIFLVKYCKVHKSKLNPVAGVHRRGHVWTLVW
jgi:hypothetical protein